MILVAFLLEKIVSRSEARSPRVVVPLIKHRKARSLGSRANGSTARSGGSCPLGRSSCAGTRSKASSGEYFLRAWGRSGGFWRANNPDDRDSGAGLFGGFLSALCWDAWDL